MDAKNVVSTTEENVDSEPIKYFQCEICNLRERYEYFGNDPPFTKQYKLLENSYVIEDPFVPPKQNQFIILGTHCIKCTKSVCKDSSCSFYYNGTYCMQCAKINCDMFPPSVQEKINRIVLDYLLDFI